MGAGKTTVGRMLAQHLGRRFLDSDHEIEQRCGVAVPVVFEIEGEQGFRARESQVIEELTALEGIVLATGGGAVLSQDNRRHLAERGVVVYLNGQPEELSRRLRSDKNRPLLAGADRLERLRELHQARDPLYRSIADVIVESGARSAHSLTRDLLARLAPAGNQEGEPNA